MPRDFQPRDMSQVRKAAAEKFSSGGPFVYASKLKENEYLHFRLLPGTASMGGADFFSAVIYNLGFGTGAAGMLMSPQSFGASRADCPIEQELKAAANSQDSSVKALLETVKRSSQVYCNIVKMEDGKPTGEPQILVGPYGIVKAFQDQWYNNPDMLHIDITHPYEGYGVKLRRKVEGKKTSYTLTIDRDSSEIPEKYYRDIADIPEMVKEKLKSDEELRAAVRAYLYGEDAPAETTKTAPVYKREPVTSAKPTSKVSLPESEEEVDAMTRSQILLILGHPDYKKGAERELDDLDEATVPALRRYLKTLVPKAEAPAKPARASRNLEEDFNLDLADLL